jgi:hypothetical protein
LAKLPQCPDEELEKLEEEVEALIVLKAGPEECEEAERAVSAEFAGIGPEEIRELRTVILIKLMRDKYRIPHLAPFYY